MKLLKITASKNFMVSGSGVEQLYQITQRMLDLPPAEQQRDNVGFQYGHHTKVKSLNIGPTMDVETISVLLNILQVYKNTQIPNFQALKQAVINDVRISDPDAMFDYDESSKVVKVLGADHYGKTLLYIPGGIDRSLVIAVNRAVRACLEAEGIEKEINQFSGKPEYPVYRHFQAIKTKINTAAVSDLCLQSVLEVLKSRKYDVSEVEAGMMTVGDQYEEKPEAHYIGIDSRYKNQINIKLPSKIYLKEEFEQAGLWSNGIWYAGREGDYARYNIALDKAKDVIDILQHHFNLDQFIIDFIEDIEGHNFGEIGKKYLEVTEAQLDGKHIGIITTAAYSKELNELIKFSFPAYPQEREYNKKTTPWQYEISSTYDQYYSFYTLLKNNNYQTEGYIAKVKELLENKILEKPKESDGPIFEGYLDGYKNDPKRFKADLDEDYGDSKIELYEAQKEGVQFLYGRHSAILGDSTGVGKTIQIIAAADQRMQRSGGNTLIITLKSTQLQWKREIMKLLGKAEVNRISFDPASPDKWTVVYYDQFSSKTNREANTEALKLGNFTVLALDELHKVKHASSARSQQIAQLSRQIPFVWGATATISANKPFDVYNQLKMINHPLGQLSETSFRRDFAGQQRNRWGWEDISEEAVENAAMNLNKWLNRSGVYIKRTKQDVREDMPNILVKDLPVDINTDEYYKEMSDKLANYADPSLAISQLIAARFALANAKVPLTVDKVSSMIEGGNKVIIFTTFKESGQMLAEKVGAIAEKLGYSVGTYLGDDSQVQRNAAKDKFTNDPKNIALIMSIKVGGTGVDFPNVANEMVINDFDWTPEQATQSEGRAYRINTEQDVNVTYVISHDTLDQELFDIVQKKRQIAAIVEKYEAEHGKGSLDKDREIEEKLKALKKKQRLLDEDALEAVNDEIDKIHAFKGRGNWYQKQKISK
jgi:superfamily II DNA or RNA helicase